MRSSATTKWMTRAGLLLLVPLVACAHNVPQDRATGPDGKLKGATPLVLEEGEGRARGIVTYPGGDRVDWKLIELPEGRRGTLDLQLTWRTPRPGLKVAFDVFDQWSAPVGKLARGGGRVRTATVPDARGKYFVRVYAPSRGDAGQYTLTATFKELLDTTVDPRDLPIPDPPRLAAVPPPEPTCEVFDPANKACATACPFDAPDGWKGCKVRDEGKRADEARAQAELARQACLKAAPQPFVVEVKHVEVQGDVVRIKLPVGTSRYPLLDSGWTAEVLRGSTTTPLTGGHVRITAVEKQLTRAEVRLTIDLLSANPRIRLTPPAGLCP